jgi:hypothetical protein
MSLITLSTVAKVLKESGVTAESILDEAGLTKEEAVAALASELGVETQVGERAVALDEDAQRVLKEAGALLTGIFSAS